MLQVNSKVYYETLSGNVLVITEERQGEVLETTKEQDMEVYPQLEGKNSDDINYIELDYGTLVPVLTNAKSFKVNLETKKLEIVYFTQEELKAIQQQNQEAQNLNSRVSDVSAYLSNSNEAIISNIENSILEIEKNKIINGGM